MMKDRIAAVLYGMAIGDAMGMPSELWGVQKSRQFFNGKITTFLDGPQENEVSRNYSKGQFTDDTSQALVILDSLFETNFIVESKNIALKLIAWADQNNAFENNILGPTSKVALTMLKENKNPLAITAKALSNGSAMRIAPIGILFSPTQKQELAQYVFEISQVTHSSDISISGAAIIAMAVSSALANNKFSQILDDIYEIDKIALKLGAQTFSPSLTKRIKLAIAIADKYKDNEDLFLTEIYDVIGAGVNISESVPSAIAIAYYAQDVNYSALLSANLGGDTDTIGAMACAICGALQGLEKIEQTSIELINQKNQVDFNYYIEQLFNERNKRGL